MARPRGRRRRHGSGGVVAPGGLPGAGPAAGPASGSPGRRLMHPAQTGDQRPARHRARIHVRARGRRNQHRHRPQRHRQEQSGPRAPVLAGPPRDRPAGPVPGGGIRERRRPLAGHPQRQPDRLAPGRRGRAAAAASRRRSGRTVPPVRREPARRQRRQRPGAGRASAARAARQLRPGSAQDRDRAEVRRSRGEDAGRGGDGTPARGGRLRRLAAAAGIGAARAATAD